MCACSAQLQPHDRVAGVCPDPACVCAGGPRWDARHHWSCPVSRVAEARLAQMNREWVDLGGEG